MKYQIRCSLCDRWCDPISEEDYEDVMESVPGNDFVFVRCKRKRCWKRHGGYMVDVKEIGITSETVMPKQI